MAAVTPLAAASGAALLGCLGPLPVGRQAAAESLTALAAGAAAGLVAWSAGGFTRWRSRGLFAMVIGVAAGAALAARAGR